MSGTVVSLDEDSRIAALFDSHHQGVDFDYSKVFKTANLYLFRGDFLSRYFVPHLEAYVASGDVDEYYESVLHTLGHRGKNQLNGVVCDDLKWYEIDDESDRLAAEYLFQSPAERYEHVSTQHGGYWRFGFTDHAYLYNPYYPPKTLFTHFQNHLRDLVLNYPVGHEVVARLIGTLIDQPLERIVVGNGASELIKIIAGRFPGKIICPVPSFNEYENACTRGTSSPSPSTARRSSWTSTLSLKLRWPVMHGSPCAEPQQSNWSDRFKRKICCGSQRLWRPATASSSSDESLSTSPPSAMTLSRRLPARGAESSRTQEASVSRSASVACGSATSSPQTRSSANSFRSELPHLEHKQLRRVVPTPRPEVSPPIQTELCPRHGPTATASTRALSDPGNAPLQVRSQTSSCAGYRRAHHHRPRWLSACSPNSTSS